jgi:primosomal protein N' (replication factor Y)
LNTPNNLSIAVLLNLDDTYTYSHHEHLDIGQIVVVNFRNKEVVGVVVDSGDNGFSGQIKKISSILPYAIPEQYVEFVRFVSNYNMSSIGMVLKLVIPFSIDAILSPDKSFNSAKKSCSNVDLSADQYTAVEKIDSYSDSFKTILLHGITGSGKTEVFVEAAKRRLPKQVLILVPEVALSNELAGKVAERLGVEVFIWHNSISKVKKLHIWRKAISGEPIAIVGARSALFIPFANLGIIIIDEEHDTSFKQSETTMYHARDMAVYLGQCLGIPVILSSATPSVESYNNAKMVKYEYITLQSRYFKDARLPSVTIHDLRKEKMDGSLSKYAIEKINEYLSIGKQVLIFVNRRGHTPKVLCRSCGWKVTCPGCSTWLCYHHHTAEFVCHYCGYRTYVKHACEECGNQNLIGIGTGIEKVYEECIGLFGDAKIAILSSDTMNTPKKITTAIKAIKDNDVNIILGTQIVAKGHNFNSLNLVVVTCIDAMLYGEDFRSIERAFQTLHQVSGRAGRMGESQAEVIVQTYCPNDELMKIIKNNDIERMYNLEIQNRKLVQIPPFARMVSIMVSALSEKEVSEFAKKLVMRAPKIQGIKILGPTQPNIYKLRSRYRMRIIVTANMQLQNYIKQWIYSKKIPNNIKVSVDVDPYDFS